MQVPETTASYPFPLREKRHREDYAAYQGIVLKVLMTTFHAEKELQTKARKYWLNLFEDFHN